MHPPRMISLANPITSFLIPTVTAECIADKTLDTVIYRPPEEVEVIDEKTRKTFKTCRVPVTENQRLSGYIPLPKRYLKVWLELSYYIVVYSNVWRLWKKEEEKARRKVQKEKAAFLRLNTGTLLAQHRLARLLTVQELIGRPHDASTPGRERVRTLDEWKVRLSRDWFNITCEEVPGEDIAFLKMDPIAPENRRFFGEFILRGRVVALVHSTIVETHWDIDDEGKGLLSVPEDLAEWFDGEIDGLDEMFKDVLKPQALAALKGNYDYYQTQYDDKAKLPARWHEGLEPRPYFWSVKHWNWAAKGGEADLRSRVCR